MVLALAGPTPMLIRVILCRRGDQMPAGIWCFFHARSEMACSGASVSAVIQIPPAQESDIGAVGIEDLAAAPADELIHVAGIVGEQHVGLEVFRRRAGVVTQTRQRKSTRRASKCDSG